MLAETKLWLRRTGAGAFASRIVAPRAAALMTPPSSHSTDARLYRSFIILHLVGPLFGLPLAATLFLLDREAAPVALAFTAGVCLFWLFPLLVRRSGGLDAPAFLSVQLLTLVSLFGSHFYGGINSPFAVWLIVAVLLTFLYVPKAVGSCLASMAVQAGLFLVAQHAAPQAPRLGEAELGLLFLSSSFAAALYVSLIAAFYARIKTEGSELAKIAGRYDDTASRLRATIGWLESENRDASEFMARASHELRTALDVVIGYSELLVEDAAAEERPLHEHHLGRIAASSRTMLALIADGDRLVEHAAAAPEPSGLASGRTLAHSLGMEPHVHLSGEPLLSGRTLLGWGLAATLAIVVIAALLGEGGQRQALPSLASGLLIVAAAALFWQRILFAPATPAAPVRDELTGLLNRAFFKQELDRRLACPDRTDVALLFADLDGFKEVNDSLGHDVGDQLLASIAERFAQLAPTGTCLARLGGDEFGAAMFGEGAEAAVRALAEAMLDAVVEPVKTEEHHLTIGVSIGLAHGKAGSITAKELLRRSDVAMYRAKSDKRSPIQTFDVQMDEALNFRRTMRQDLADALRGDQLDLHLQPVVDARSGELASAEALLRWTHPLLGSVSPAKLVSLAEESGQIVALDDWVLERALEHAKRLRAVPIAVNISPVQFRHPGFARKIVDRLSAHSVPAQLLRLEITEGVLVTHTRAANRAIAELREAGVKIALDDFGTGFSSLSYLKDFRFDFLKVDRSFVLALDEGRQGAELLRAIVDLGHSLGMAVVAEGVETASQAGLVQLLGCDFIQGYFTGAPMRIDRFEAWVAEKGEALSSQRPEAGIRAAGAARR